MEKRIFIAVVISIALLWTWAAVAPKLFPDLVKKPAPQQTARTSSVAVTKATTTTAASATAGPAKAAAAVRSTAATTAPVSANAEEQARIDTPDFAAVFSNRGAELISFQLKHYSVNGPTPTQKLPVELVKARDPRRSDFPFAIEAKDLRVTEQLNMALYSVAQRVENGVHVLEYRYSADGVSATKTFRIGNDYQFDFAVTVAPALPYRVVVGPGIRTLAPDERDSQFIITGNGIVETNGKLKILAREKTDRISIVDDVQFIGIEDNYFLSVLKPVKAGGGIIRRVEIKSADPKVPARKELYAGLNAAPDGAVVGQAFFGPKQTTVLEKYGLEAALQFGFFGFIARFLLELLIWINKFAKNYGFAIIVLTILIKVVLYPLQHKSIVSMKKMQKAQPKVESIKNKYKKSRTDPEQRQKMNVEMMNLYKQEGINPMGGCLPIVLQLPILWGFYGLLGRAIELRGAPFIWWIHDLSAKDPDDRHHVHPAGHYAYHRRPGAEEDVHDHAAGLRLDLQGVSERLGALLVRTEHLDDHPADDHE
jgi:YidC/Oxa1 family membrane protein insertase